MRRRLLAPGALVVALAILAAVPAAAGGRTTKILEFQTMVGVPQALTGAQAPIRGINGGGVPWVVGSAKGELSTDGKLEVKVTGLVIDPAANSPAAGTNPIGFFRAIVSCLKADGTPGNVETGQFPATTGSPAAGGGNAEIEATVTLPHPCIAPIVFVTSPGLNWFAATGG